MELTLTLVDRDGNDVIAVFPAKYEACYECEGFGTILNPSIGEHAYSMEEFYEEFPEPEDRDEYFRRGGIYDVKCPCCKGKRVVAVIDERHADPELLKLHRENEEREAYYRAEREAERRFGC